jgi:hypothetical protein
MPKYAPEPSRFRTCLNSVPIHQKLMEGINIVKVASVSSMHVILMLYGNFSSSPPMPFDGCCDIHQINVSRKSLHSFAHFLTHPPCSSCHIIISYSPQNGKTQPAYLTLSEDRFTLYITQKQVKNGKVIRKPFLVRVTSIGSNDDEAEFERSIDIGSVDRLQSGRKTLRFELARYVQLYDVV